MGVIKVVSGGQTGADQAGLFAAVGVGIKTGGWVPKGWLTEDGPAPWLADFGLKETQRSDYATRTELNVEGSHGTVLFGRITSVGSELTRGMCHKHKRPLLHFDFPWNFIARKEYFGSWLVRENIRVLNVAGNRESKNPGIKDAVMEFLLETLENG